MLRVFPAPKPGKVSFPVLFQSLLQKMLFLLVSFFVILYSLGYRINFATYSIQQTGLITLNSDVAGLRPQVTLDGQPVEGKFPIRFGWLFPGTYTVRIMLDGYQTWERVVRVEANQAYTFTHILLVWEKPVEMPVTQAELEQLAERPADDKDVHIKNSNELWLKKKLLKRTSADIGAAVWFPDGNHIVYQAGNELLITELDGRGTQKLASLGSDVPATLAFMDGGRIIVIGQGETVRSVALYQDSGILSWLPTGPSEAAR